MINYHDYCIIEDEHLYGPGKRLLFFTQGCSIHCKGCINSHLWKFGCGRNISATEILHICQNNEVDGITLHGGEPLDQAKEVFETVKLLKNNGFTVVLFTGYIKKEITKYQIKVWNLADIIVSGKFLESKKNLYLQFRGSTNQRIYTHKGKYKGYKPIDGKTVAILTFDNNGDLNIKGFFSDEIKSIIDMNDGFRINK